jgi:16S rRNA (cytosine1402-N4)-methyltransferase
MTGVDFGMTDAPHIPVMLEPVLHGLAIDTHPDGLYIDGTLGAGGHTEAILTRAAGSRVMGFDRDPAALALATARLALFGDRFASVHASYEQMGERAPQHGFSAGTVDGILLDLGISSMQVDQADRGFAFKHDGALDMRFDPTSDTPTAADLVNTLAEGALADIFYQYGEENDSRRIARAIVQARAAQSITRTRQLADIIAGAIPKAHQGKIHPATRSFQALRIAVNDELGAVERVLPIALSLLRPGGRLVVISFHSLEDRLVKQFMKLESTDCICPPKQPICTCGHKASIALVSRKPISADAAEIARNPRARSAQLRVAERL